jgi:hypothetical protein
MSKQGRKKRVLQKVTLRLGSGQAKATLRRFDGSASSPQASSPQAKLRASEGGPPAAGGGEEASGRRKCGRMGVWACGRGVGKRLEAVEPLELLNR